MKEFDEIWKDKRVKTHDVFHHGWMGYIELKGRRSPFAYVATVDGGRYEHVSVHITGATKKTPSWEDMCEIKDIFWQNGEEVHQIHPKVSEYIHGFGVIENILHLWRPVGGWDW